MSIEKSSQAFLGEFHFEKKAFQGVETILRSFQSLHFSSLNDYQKSSLLNKALIQLLKEHQHRGFLLPEVIDFIDRVHELSLIERYTMSDIELWLNQFSGVSQEENAFYRGLIAGKYIPREAYQVLFPIGMGKSYPGSHFVTAHQSPDIDTIVASFWGWMDAFAARVGTGVHLWNVPGGPPESSVEVKLLFYDILHPKVFHYLSKNRSQLAVTSLDLMTQEGFVRKKRFEHSLGMENDRAHHAVVLVDDEGYYLGDWRSFDVEGVRQVIMLLNLCLRWFETTIHLMLFALFSKKDISKQDLFDLVETIKSLSLDKCDPIQEMTLRQQTLLEGFLAKILGVKTGICCNFSEFVDAASSLEITDFGKIWNHFDRLAHSELFDTSGKMLENRPLIFFHMEKIIKDLNDLFRLFRTYLDTMDIAFKVKTEVFGHAPSYVSYRTDVKEIESQMGAYPYLTVNIPGPEDKQIPVGVITAIDLKRPFLGTATLRDFCNREETKVPSYLEVISVIDHHKSSLNTNTAPTAWIADAQSANSLVCQMAFSVHDLYSLGGMSIESIDAQIAQLSKTATTPCDYRLLKKLYNKKEVFLKKGSFYVDPTREFLEYLQYLFAILDDTDLLTKVSYRDVISVAELINRLKSLMLKREIESVHFDDIENGSGFVKQAAAKLLRNEDLYSLYRVSSAEKEEAIAENLLKGSRGEPSDIFVDTKVQNGCCRVGQTKMFAKNHALFEGLCEKIRLFWYEQALHVNHQEPDVDLHLYMTSTVAGAEELFKGKSDKYAYQDQMWIWIPKTDLAVEHLKLFLSAFRNSPGLENNSLRLEFYGCRAKELSVVFKESFLSCPSKILQDEREMSCAVLYYDAGTLNSRKAMVSPFLPKLTK